MINEINSEEMTTHTQNHFVCLNMINVASKSNIKKVFITLVHALIINGHLNMNAMTQVTVRDLHIPCVAQCSRVTQ